MADQWVTEQANASGGVWWLVEQDVVQVSEAWWESAYFLAESAADASDLVTPFGYHLNRSAAAAEGAPFGMHVNRTVQANDTANARDRVRLGLRTFEPEQVADASDAATTSGHFLLTESATAADEVIRSAQAGVTLASSAQAAGDAWIAFMEMPAVVADAEAALKLGGIQWAQAVGTAADDLMASNPGQLFAVSRADARSTVWLQVHSRNMASVVADALDQLLMADPYAMAIVMNAETGAPYFYNNFPMMAAAQSGESVFAIGPDGIYRLDGYHDEDQPIEAYVEFAGLDLKQPDGRGNLSGSPEHKRMESVWIDGESSTAMTVDVRSYDQGGACFRYRALRPIERHGNMKVPTGKGLRSRWYGLTIRNTRGGDFAMTGATADVLPTERRR